MKYLLILLIPFILISCKKGPDFDAARESGGFHIYVGYEEYIDSSVNIIINAHVNDVDMDVKIEPIFITPGKWAGNWSYYFKVNKPQTVTVSAYTSEPIETKLRVRIQHHPEADEFEYYYPIIVEYSEPDSAGIQRVYVVYEIK